MAVWIGLASISTPSHATMIVTNGLSTFLSLGTIDHNSTFEDFGDTFAYPGDPFTRGGVTYNSSQNATFGTNSGIAH